MKSPDLDNSLDAAVAELPDGCLKKIKSIANMPSRLVDHDGKYYQVTCTSRDMNGALCTQLTVHDLSSSTYYTLTTTERNGHLVVNFNGWIPAVFCQFIDEVIS